MRLPRLAFCLLLCVLLAACAGAKYTDQPLTSVDLTEQGAGAGVSSRVLAQAGEWRNTGVLVKQGVDYALSTNGRWRAWPGCKWTDADGLGMYTGLCLDLGGTIIKGWTHQALIARIGETGSPFAVGKAFRFTAPADGLLYLHINEQDHGVWDNEGYVDVSVSLAGPLAPGLAPGLALVPAPAQLAAQAQAVPQPPGPRAKKSASSAGPGAGAAPSVLASQPMPQPAPQSAPQSAPQPSPQPAPQPQAETVPAYQPPAHQVQGKTPLRRVALVIGNGTYPSAPLRNPVNDARDMAATLRGLGFEVILRENASLRQMEDAVDELWKRLKAGGAGLFFFAGHGLQVAGRNYLVPVDARLAAEQDVKYRCMDAGLVLGRMENAGNQLNIVILDACRNNPYSRNFRSVNEGLAKMDAPRGSIVAYATAPDSVAADGAGKNGVYTGQLLKHMRTPGLPIEEMFKRVRIGVLGETQEKQVPWEASSLTGDFSFKELPR